MKRQRMNIIVVSMLMGVCSASAQGITATERSEVIDKVIAQVANRYVDPNRGRKVAETIKERQEKHAYDGRDTKASLSKALTADMYATTRDRQLQVKDRSGAGFEWIHPAITVKVPDGTKPDDLQLKKSLLQFMSYGLPAQVQEGNIGCLCVLEFYSPAIAPEVYQVIDKTMRSFQQCTAMILDLRQCSRGGDPEVMMYLASYLLGGEEPQLLYVSFDRENQKAAEFRTRTDITGEPISRISLYILVSSETFSTGEMFAYGLQKAGRARIVGEPSAGAAHGTDTIDIDRDITMVLPVNRLAHAKTNTNWEGTGVIPDVPAKAEEALDIAKGMIQEAQGNAK